MPYPNGTYVLQYTAVTSAGTFTDNVNVTVTPSDTDPGTGGGGGSIGTYPSSVAVGPTAVSNSSTTVTVQPPSGVANGQFQICIVQLDIGAESITNPPAGWQLLDEQGVPSPAPPSNAVILYNTTGYSGTLTLDKSGSGAYHAVRMSWKDWSALGQHLSRASSSTTTPYAPTVTPGTDKALVVTVLGSEREPTGVGPVSVPTGWTQRYNSGQVTNSVNYEWIAVAELQVDNKTAAGANAPTGTGVGTSNFTLTNADNCSMFSFVLEGAISTGVGVGGAVSLQATPTLTLDYHLPPVPVGGLLLTALPQLIARTVVRGGVNLYALSNITFSASVFPRGAFIILPTLTFGTRQTFFQGILLKATPVLRAGALPYRRPVLRTDYKYPPLDHPFRLIAQRVLDGEIVEWELPVSEDFQYTEQLSGPVVMQGSIRPELIQVQELDLDGYAYWLHVEINQEIRASAILLPPQYTESEMSFSAEGVSAMPHYHYYQSVFRQIQVDPFSVVRTLWNYVQSQPESDLGVVVSSNSSPVRLGEPARTETTTITNTDGTTTTTVRDIPAKPYELLWWEATNIGEEIDTLSGQTPFDYVERHAWNSNRTDVLHYVDLGYPRLGVARPNLLFNEENILEVVPVQEPEDTYASAVLVIGAGDGEDTIRGYAAQSYGDRLRKEVTITDKTINTVERANARAQSELAFRRGRTFEASEIVINAYHPNAPIGSYQIGDDIQIQVDIPWLMLSHTSWYRVTSIQNKPSSDKVRLGLARSDTLLDTSDIWIAPDNYIPFTPPPPIGAVAWNGNVSLHIVATLVITPSVPVPTARAIFVITPTLTANGVGFGGSFAFVNNLFTSQSLTIGQPTGTVVGAIALLLTPSLVASGIATGAGFGTVTLIATTTLTSTTGIARAGLVSMSAIPVLTLTTTGVFATTATLTASPSLTVGSVQTRSGAVSLSASPALTANGTISTTTTITQLGNTTDDTASTSSSANKTVVSKFTASASGTVTAGHARLWVDTGTASPQMVVYSDSSGSPGTLLGLSNAITVSNTTKALKDFTFSGAQQASVVAGTDYWIGFTWPDPGTNNISWSRGATASSAQQNALNAATTFGTPGTALSGPIDAYVDVSSSTSSTGEVLIDASSPAAVKSDTAVSSLTTAAFTPPAGSILLMMAIFDTATNTRTGTPSTVTGSTSAWTTVGNFNNGNGTQGGLVHVSWARVTGSQSTTVRVTWPASNDCALKVWVLTGAPDTGSPIGANGSATMTTNPQTVSYTTTASGSQGFIGLEDFSQAGVKSISNTASDTTLTTNSNGLIAHDLSTSTAVGQTRSFSVSGTPANSSIGWVEVIPGASGGGGSGGGFTTGGSGGPLTDRTSVSYTNTAGTASTGHIYAAGLDWTKKVGVLVYTDGSGEFGLANPTSTYLLAGTNGLIAKAKAQNMILVTPRAPGNGCNDGDGVCWYDASFDGTSITTKVKWADDFIQNQVLTKYDIDTRRVCIAGYSSGAQFTMEYYGPQYASAWMTDGLLLAISYGGSPKVTANYPTAFKQNVSAVWDVGSTDPAYQSSGSFGVQAGYDWYTANGFTTTELTVVAGEDHARDGLFGGIVDREITQHVIPA